MSTENEKDAGASILELARTLTQSWVETGCVPDNGIEAMTPALRALLSPDGVAPADPTSPESPSFEDYVHKHYVRPDWGFFQLEVPGVFEAPLELYLPVDWQIVPIEGHPGAATINDADGVRHQGIQVLQREAHGNMVDAVFGSGDMLGFEVGTDFDGFDHWRFVLTAGSTYVTWSIFTAGELSVLYSGSASDVDGLKRLLQSSMNSIPWYHWIEWAKHSAEQAG